MHSGSCNSAGRAGGAQANRPQGGLWGALGGLTLAGALGCSDPLLVLDISYQSGETQLQLQAQLQSGMTQNPTVVGKPDRVAVSLPGDASGQVQLNLLGQGPSGCRVSQKMLQVDVPGGLSRASELQVVLEPMGSPTPECTADGWCRCVPTAPTENLAALSAFRNGGALAVGQNGMLQRCQGLQCTPLGLGMQPDLLAVWTGTTNMLYAVGNARVVRCDASTSGCTTLTDNARQKKLRSVWGSDANNIYAVGDDGVVVRCNDSTSECTALNGNASPVPSFAGVYGSDANNVYAVGTAGTVVRCSAGKGSCKPLTTGTTQDLRSVWAGDANNVYVAGNNGVLLRCAAGIDTCEPLMSFAQPFNAIWGSDASHVYAVGDGGIIVMCAMGTTVCSPLTSPTKANLRAVWASDPANVFAVGDGGAILHCAGLTCTLLSMGPTQNLRAVWGSDASHVYAVGDGGTVIFKGP